MVRAHEFLDRLASLMPPPRRHRHRYHGAFAPNAALRPLVTAAAGQPLVDVPAHTPARSPPCASATHTPEPNPTHRRASYRWAQLLARIYACFPLICPRCQSPMRLLAFITEPATIRRMLTHLGEPGTPPPISPARGPPLDPRELDQTTPWDPAGPQPDPGFQFDQSRGW